MERYAQAGSQAPANERVVDFEIRGGGKIPGGVSDVWQTQGLETLVFGSVAMIGLTGEFSDVWQGKDLGDRERREYTLPRVFL